MTPEDWERIKPILSAALEHPPPERAALLSRLCEGDESFRAEIESLIAAHDAAGTFIEAPALSTRTTPAVVRQPDASRVGVRIGSYEITRELGHGGMGVVYLAARADHAFRQQVAIKIVRGSLVDAQLAERFRHERQILANLNHPGIARLIDGGATAEGAPYLVMEYVDGVAIDRFCDSAGLDTRGRLALFRLVCDAVHYAHRNLVIHRDIKPGNILVAADGGPKLLDFGIARLIETDERDSTLAMRAFTPEYASPEQIRGEPMTTASDVYSLAVLLYLLLTGRRPYGHADDDPVALARAACEVEPAAPGTAARDLDAILLKALQKEPARRYGTVEQFSDDLGRYLDRRPVLAAPDTLAYRTRTFVRRHTVAVASAAALVSTLAAATVVTAWQARVAERSRARAEQRFEDVRRLATFVMFDMHDAIVKLPGATAARRQLVAKALEYLDRLGSERLTDPALLAEIARGYDRLGRVQGHPQWANLGDHAGAVASMGKAIALREQLTAGRPDDAVRLAELAESYGALGRIFERQGRSIEARAALDRMRSTLERVPSRHVDDTVVIDATTVYYGSMAVEQAANRDWTGLAETRRRQVAAATRLLAREPASIDRRRGLALAYTYQGKALQALAEWKRAGDLFVMALELDGAVVAAEPQNPHFKLDLAFGHASMASLRRDQGDLEGALDAYREAVALGQQAFAADAGNDFAAERLASFLAALGDVCERVASRPATPRSRQVEYWRRAREGYSRALAMWVSLAERAPLEDEGAATSGQLREKIGRSDEALERLRIGR